MFVGSVWLSCDAFFAVIPASLYYYLGGKEWRHIYIQALILP